MALTRVHRILIAGAAIIALGFIGHVSYDPGVGPGNASAPRKIAFQDLALDAQSLADNGANIEIEGVYEALGSTLELLYGPQHTAMGFSDDSIRLLTDNSPRDVREIFYRCRQDSTGTSGCAVAITGHMGICHLKINENATFPCLYVENATLR